MAGSIRETIVNSYAAKALQSREVFEFADLVVAQVECVELVLRHTKVFDLCDTVATHIQLTLLQWIDEGACAKYHVCREAHRLPAPLGALLLWLARACCAPQLKRPYLAGLLLLRWCAYHRYGARYGMYVHVGATCTCTYITCY